MKKALANHKTKTASSILCAVWIAFSFCLCVLPAHAQSSFDPVSTFVPLGHQDDKNEYLARTLKNEQELKFRTIVMGRPGVVLVEFALPTCAACDPASKAIIELLSRFGGRAHYVRLDLNKNLGLSYKYDVPDVPAVLLFKNGRLAQRFVTFRPEQRNELAISINKLLTEPPRPGESNMEMADKVKKPYTLTY
jgi:thioredoxin 1